MLYFKLAAAILLFAATTIGWQILVRQLANLGIFWVRGVEMTALAIMKDRSLSEILVICSEKVWEEIKICCNITTELNQQSTLAKIFGFRQADFKGARIIRLKKSLYYIGRPWVYKVFEWYFTQKEEQDVRVRPLHSLTLAILNLIYEPEEIDPETGVRNLMTADGIEVKGKLTFYGAIRNPEKALFNVDYIKTFIRDLIIPSWLAVLSEFQFFHYEKMDGAESADEYLIAAMKDLNEKLREKLGIPKDIEHKEFQNITNELEGVARVLYGDAGIVMKDITLGEFEPVNVEVRNALEQILIARTTAKKRIQEAEGEMRARILKGEGERGYLDKLGPDKGLLLAIRAIETATENLGKVQNLTLLNIEDILGPLTRHLRKPLEN